LKIPIVTNFLERRSRLREFEEWMDHIVDGSPAHAGVRVNEKTAIQVVAVFACIRLLAETIGSLPFPVYERLSKGKRKARDHPLYTILHDLPNPEMTAMDFKICMMVNCLLYGTAYAEKVKDRAGDLMELWPISSTRVIPSRNSNNDLVYKIRMPDGTEQIWSQDRMFRVNWVTANGITGYKPLEIAKEAIGAAIATNTFSNMYFSNGTATGGIVEYPGRMSDPAYDRYKKDFAGKYTGVGNSHRIIFLEEGLKFTKITTPPNDSQMLETRKFHVEEAARLFNVPPHMIMDMARATFNNIEHQSINFSEYSIRPWAVRWEQSIFRDLIRPEERRLYFAEILLDGLVRGDLESRYKAYATGRQWGWLSADDVREKENMNPLSGGQGDIYMVPMNMIPANQAKMLDEPDPEANNRQASIIENREKRTATQRAKLASANKRIFRDVGKRIVKREVADIRNNFKKLRDATDFKSWLAEFYNNHDWIKRTYMPVAMTYAEMMQETAASELDSEVTDIMKSEMETFIDDYTETFAARHSGSSKGQLIKVVDDAVAAGEEPVDMVEARLQEWEQKRPDKIARDETVRISGAVVRLSFAALGVKKLVWRNTGSKTCPYCEQLNGRVVGIDQPFILQGDFVEADDGSGLRVYGPKMHAPIHEGCQCQVEPEV
jgi:HK97 family phage portal protein